MLHFVVGTIIHGYNMVEHSVAGANNCTGTNYNYGTAQRQLGAHEQLTCVCLQSHTRFSCG